MHKEMQTMTLLKRGMKGPEVADLQTKLNQIGYALTVDGDFGPITESVVIDFQMDKNLEPDGIVGEKTWASIYYALSPAEIPQEAIDTYQEVIKLPSGLPRNALDKRISDQIMFQQKLDNNQGCRYGGWTNPYWFDKAEFKKGTNFRIPKVGKIISTAGVVQPVHGGTCSPWAGLVMGWYTCVNADFNFRIGRNARWIATWKYNHKDATTGVIIPGYGDYCEVNGNLKLEYRPLNVLYQYWEWLYKVNIVEMEHHVILVLKVGGDDGLWLEDPKNPGQALPPGIYRWAADGNYPMVNGVKYYSGTRQTFRRIAEVEKTSQAWDFYRVKNMDSCTCSPVDGPWKGRTPWGMTAE
jgi:hypothetical protein